MNFFDGSNETVRLKRGQSFGIPPDIYQCLAQVAISASELTSIDATVLEPLENGKPGAVCTLCGAKLAFSILVECIRLTNPIWSAAWDFAQLGG